IASFDSNLAATDTNGLQDIFVRDLLTGAVMPAMLDPTGLFAPGQGAVESAVSANGQFIVVGSKVPCLLDYPWFVGCGYRENLVRFDLTKGTADLVSARFDGAGAAGNSCAAPAIS